MRGRSDSLDSGGNVCGSDGGQAQRSHLITAESAVAESYLEEAARICILKRIDETDNRYGEIRGVAILFN